MSERVAIAKAIEERIGDRQGQRTDASLPDTHPEVAPGTETREAAAKAAGFGSDFTYRQAAKVVEQAVPELVAAVDAGDVSVSAAAGYFRFPIGRGGGSGGSTSDGPKSGG